MKTLTDPILRSTSERLVYSQGELLGKDDFRDEQTYHRRQLARALFFLHGRGVVAGLKVETRTEPDRKDLDPAVKEFEEIHLLVQPGLAIDGAGRLVEVPRNACLRLGRWFNYVANRPSESRTPQNPAWDVADLRAAWRPEGGGAVVADVFLTFHACNRGLTPAFASGPFDALDASQPSRVRDAYELSLVLRAHDSDLPTAFDPWSHIRGATAQERLAAAQEGSLNAWKTLEDLSAESTADLHEIPLGVDRTAVLLARVRLPASGPPANLTKPPGANWKVEAWAAAGSNIDNGVRNFILPAAAIRRLAGV